MVSVKKDEQSIFSPSISDSSDCEKETGNQKSKPVEQDILSLKDKKWRVLDDRNQVKLKEMRLQKIMKLVDTCSIPAFGLSMPSADAHEDPAALSSSSIYQAKLFKWIEELESFDI